MLSRSPLRNGVAGLALLAGLLGTAAISHAQVAFWHQARPDARLAPGARAQAGGWEMASVRAESRDHVRAQIERMEARARADDRLSGRPAPSPAALRNEEHAPPAERERSPDNARNDPRPTGMGPGWQVRERENGR